MQSIAESLVTPIKGAFDVIVCGGGVAGVAASLSAARDGKKVLLLEKSVTLGGLATIGLINYFVPMCNGRGRQIVTGIAEELLRLSISLGYDSLPEAWRNGQPKEVTQERYVTKYSPNIFAMRMAQLLRDEGVTILLDSLCVRTVLREGTIQAVVVENKGGRFAYECGFAIDATGDADILQRAGVPTIIGKNYYTYIAEAADLAGCARALQNHDIRALFSSVCGGCANLYGGGHPQDMPLWEGVTAEDITEYILSNQKLLLSSLKAEERTQRDIVMLPSVPQMRTTRHIDGDYTLQTADAYKHFDDSIGLICDFDRNDYVYEVPIGTLMHHDFKNIATCGRCASANGYAWDVLRVIPPAILTGQAAGVIASVTLSTGKTDISQIQSKLTQAGVKLHNDA